MAEKHQNMNEILQNNITGAISTHIFLKPPPPPQTYFNAEQVLNKFNNIVEYLKVGGQDLKVGAR